MQPNRDSEESSGTLWQEIEKRTIVDDNPFLISNAHSESPYGSASAGLAGLSPFGRSPALPPASQAFSPGPTPGPAIVPELRPWSSVAQQQPEHTPVTHDQLLARVDDIEECAAQGMQALSAREAGELLVSSSSDADDEGTPDRGARPARAPPVTPTAQKRKQKRALHADAPQHGGGEMQA